MSEDRSGGGQRAYVRGNRSADRRADRRAFFGLLSAALSCAALLMPTHELNADTAGDAAGYARRIESKPYLNMPSTPSGAIPKLLSQTGAFKDVRNLVPVDALIPYDLVVPFWSDGARKLRYVAVPKGKIKFASTGEWTFPAGTVFVKTFELPVDARDPTVKRRLETRLLMVGADSQVYGVVYRWRADLSDADLLPDSLSEDIPLHGADGSTHRADLVLPEPQGLHHLSYHPRGRRARPEDASDESRFCLSVRSNR